MMKTNDLLKKANRKKIAAGFVTLAAAAALIVANGAFTLKVFAFNEAPEIQTGQSYQQPGSTPSSVPVTVTTPAGGQIETSLLEDSDDMAAKRTAEDMSKEQAVKLAAKAVEDKFGVSLNNTYATPIFCQLEDIAGNYYFVSFVDKQALKAETDQQAQMNKKAGGNNYNNPDVYITFLNAKTGEIISVDKNPTAPATATNG